MTRSSTQLGRRKTSKHVSWRCQVLITSSVSEDPLLFPVTGCLCKYGLHSLWGQILDDVKNRYVVGLKIILGLEVTAEACPVLHSCCCGSSRTALLMWGLEWDCILVLSKTLFLSGGHFKRKHISFKSEGNNHKIILETEFLWNRFGYLSLWFIFSFGWWLF